MSLISVIVPVYNVESYLERCLDSILGQTFRDLEVILVDDGSEDRSGEICRSYARKDARIRYVRQENGGLGRARNRGIQMAEGEFILFVDSDDYIDRRMAEILLDNLTSSGADVASCGVYNVFVQKTTPQYDKIEKFLSPREEAFGLLLLGDKIPGSACNKLYRSWIFREVQFPEGVFYEDVGFHTRLMQVIRNIYVDTTPLYYYVHREDSITTRKFDSRAMMFITAYEETLKVVREKDPAVLPQAEFKLTWAYFSILDRMLQEEEYRKIPEYPRVLRFLKRNTVRIIRSPYFHRARKAGAAALLVNVRLYRQMIRMNERKNKGIYA